MNQSKKNEVKHGVTLSKENRIISTNNMNISIYLQIYQVILIVLGILGPLYSFTTGLDIMLRQDIMVFTVIGSVLFFYVFFRIKKDGVFVIGISIFLYIIIAYEFLKEIQNGFWQIENIVIKFINKYYGLNILYYKVDKLDKTLVISIFLSFVIILLAAVVSILVLFNKGIYIYSLIAIVTIGIPLSVGNVPHILWIAMVLIVVISSYGMSKLNQSSTMLKSKNRILANQFNHVISLKVGTSISALLISLFFVVPFFFSSESYDALNIPMRKAEVKKKVENISFERVGEELKDLNFKEVPKLIHGIDNKIGGLSGGKLFKDGEVTFDQKKVLEVTLPYIFGAVYLKGYVGTTYTKDAWIELSREELSEYENKARTFNPIFNQGNQSSNLLAIIDNLNLSLFKKLEFYRSEMYVDQILTNKTYTYHPYYSVFDERKYLVERPLYMVNTDWNQYEKFDYYRINTQVLDYSFDEEYQKAQEFYQVYDSLAREDNSSLNNLVEFTVSEQSYRDYVYDTYTKLNDNISKRLREDFSWDTYSIDGKRVEGKQLSDFIEQVQNYLRENTSYSLKPGPLPKDKDYIEYFLYDNKIGYCAHYASAATVMLRIMGVPARYVEGYIVKNSNIKNGITIGEGYIANRNDKEAIPVDVKSVSILDSNAHAWVEVYVDGIGFVPVEFTVGYDSNSGENPEIDEVVEQITSTPTPIPTKIPTLEEEEDKKPIPTNIPTEVPVEGDIQIEEDKNNESGRASNDEENKTFDRESYERKLLYKVVQSVLKILLVIFLLLLCIGIRYLIFCYIRYRNYYNKLPNEIILLKYKEFMRMVHYLEHTNLYDGNSFNEKVVEKEYTSQYEEVKNKFLLDGIRVNRMKELAEKAKFSTHTISINEMEEANTILNHTRRLVYYEKSQVQQWYLKYVRIY